MRESSRLICAFSGSHVNIAYLDEVMRATFENAMLVDSNNVRWLRMLADYRYGIFCPV